jgi:uncharacterized protein (TIGR03000 family)
MLPAISALVLLNAFAQPVRNPKDLVDVRSVPAPAGAVVLFDGTSWHNWVLVGRAGTVKWQIVEHAMQTGVGDLRTRSDFSGHFKLHVEFRVPDIPDAEGLDRGNSGIFLQGLYQVQILDSYGRPADVTSCGALAGAVAPRVNVSKAPGVWQNFDIEFWSPLCERRRILRSPRLGVGPDYYTLGSLRVVEPARFTVHQNGVKIHDRVKISREVGTPALAGNPCEPGPIVLQGSGQPVQFRNIWLVQDGGRAEDADTPRPARVTVRLPAEAGLWFNGTRLAGSGSARTYLSPPLEPGYKYSYEIKASWPEDGREVERVKTVKVRPGGSVVVDFQK